MCLVIVVAKTFKQFLINIWSIDINVFEIVFIDIDNCINISRLSTNTMWKAMVDNAPEGPSASPRSPCLTTS